MTEEDIAHLYDCCDATHTVVIDEFNRMTHEVIFNESGKLMGLSMATENG
jgi:hypothetical protein